MNVPLYIENPPDGTATYNVFDVYYSGDAYASILITVSIDLSTRSQYSPGYTLTVHTSGNNYTYKVRARNTTNSQVSGFSILSPEDSSYAIREAQRLLDDEVSASALFTEEDLVEAERRAVGRLFPRILADVSDDSLATVESQIDYGLPVGVFRITRIDKGTQATDDLTELDNFEIINGKTLRLSDGDVGDVAPLTIYFKRKFRDAGEVPMVLQNFLVYEILAECYETLANTRGVKFQAFQALQRDTDVRPETFKQLAAQARQTAEEFLARVERG